MCVYIYIYIYTYIHVYMYVYVCRYVCLYVCMHLSLSLSIYIYIHVYICVHIFIYIYIYPGDQRPSEKGYIIVHSRVGVDFGERRVETRILKRRILNMDFNMVGAPKRGRHSTIFFPPNASVQWQPDGLIIRTDKWFLGAGLLGAPPMSLRPGRGRAHARSIV